MGIETLAWDVADHLDTPERVACYLEAVLEDGDPELIAAALADVARARGLPPAPAALRVDALVDMLRTLGLRLSVLPLEVAAEGGDRR